MTDTSKMTESDWLQELKQKDEFIGRQGKIISGLRAEIRALHNAMTPQMNDNRDFGRLAEMTESLHVCRQCGCLWRLWKGNDGWSLADEHQKPGQCCDNSADFVQQLRPIVGDTPCSVAHREHTKEDFSIQYEAGDGSYWSCEHCGQSIRR